MNKLDNIRIVLVATTHPGNIGATARAMKTMGITRLDLVKPKIFPSAETTARAAGADDILSSIRVYEDLKTAVKDCEFVAGTTARTRNISWPVTSPQQAAGEITRMAGKGMNIAILFGTENSGLSNEDIELCNSIISIPANTEFSSLNLASAVQIICYELRKSLTGDNELSSENSQNELLANVEQMNLFFDHLEKSLTDIGFYDPEKPRLLMRRLKRLFNRAQLDINEYNILRGILSAAQNAAKKRKN